MHERYRRQTTDRRQTDGRTMTYSEHELEFTFAKNNAKIQHASSSSVNGIKISETRWRWWLAVYFIYSTVVVWLLTLQVMLFSHSVGIVFWITPKVTVYVFTDMWLQRIWVHGFVTSTQHGTNLTKTLQNILMLVIHCCCFYTVSQKNIHLFIAQITLSKINRF